MRFGIASTLIFLGIFFQFPVEAREKVTVFSLENGLEVVVIEDHDALTVAHMVWYRVGAADEPSGKSGIAHLVEHLMFHGTEKFASSESSRGFAGNGEETKAFFSYDYTSYFQRIDADRLELMMKLEADRMRSLKFTGEEFENERFDMLAERRQIIERSPDRLFAEQRMAALYLNHPYGIPVNGWRHEFENLTESDAREFFRRHYAPNNAILLVAGSVRTENVRELAERHYGSIEPNPEIEPRIRPVEPPHRAERRLKFKDERVRRPYLVRHYLAPERDPGEQKTAAALTVLTELLAGSGSDSVLAQKLVAERMVALHTSAFYSGTAYDDTSFGVFVMPANGVTLEEAETALDEVFEGFLKVGPEPEHMQRVKKSILTNLADEMKDVQAQALKYGHALAAGLSVEDVQGWPGTIEELTVADIVDAASSVLKIERSVTGWMMTKDSD